MLLGMAIPVLEFQNLGYKIRVLYMSFEKFLLAVESGDLSQADKSIVRVSSKIPAKLPGQFSLSGHIFFALGSSNSVWQQKPTVSSSSLHAFHSINLGCK